jgi:mRNA-degrading endonuclease toxin of MazEF toxin-antitoxin module
VHPRANTVLIVPFSTTLTEIPIHVRLQPGETGLAEISELQPENVSIVRKETIRPLPSTRMLGERILRVVARNIVLSLGIQPKDL